MPTQTPKSEKIAPAPVQKTQKSTPDIPRRRSTWIASAGVPSIKDPAKAISHHLSSELILRTLIYVTCPSLSYFSVLSTLCSYTHSCTWLPSTIDRTIQLYIYGAVCTLILVL